MLIVGFAVHCSCSPTSKVSRRRPETFNCENGRSAARLDRLVGLAMRITISGEQMFCDLRDGDRMNVNRSLGHPDWQLQFFEPRGNSVIIAGQRSQLVRFARQILEADERECSESSEVV